ncbi:hypothetical protein VTK26DRAFT_1629 [Humicola hyalothermophila]
MSLLPSWLRLGSPTTKMDPCPCVSHDSLTIIEKADLLLDQLADAKSQKVQWLVRNIVGTHAELLKLPDLKPGKAINQLLGNLVSICSEIYDRDIVEKVLTNRQVLAILPSLRQICAEAESCLELHWVGHILEGQASPSSPDSVLARLHSFPYYANYEALTRLELCTILSATSPSDAAPCRVAFIGSGPLPLTSLCLLHALKEDALVRGMSATARPPVVLNIDHDPAAIAASLKLSLALGSASAGTKPLGQDQHQDLAEFDVVYLAALVGMSQLEKEEIVLAVAGRMRRGALLVVRSAWGLRTCLYPEVDLATERLLERLEVCVVMHPYGQVVNSVVVARVR